MNVCKALLLILNRLRGMGVDGQKGASDGNWKHLLCVCVCVCGVVESMCVKER